jgi:hypothetical protein
VSRIAGGIVAALHFVRRAAMWLWARLVHRLKRFAQVLQLIGAKILASFRRLWALALKVLLPFGRVARAVVLKIAAAIRRVGVWLWSLLVRAGQALRLIGSTLVARLALVFRRMAARIRLWLGQMRVVLSQSLFRKSRVRAFDSDSESR